MSASYGYRASYYRGPGYDNGEHIDRTNPRPDWEGVRGEVSALLARVEGMALDPRFRQGADRIGGDPGPLPVDPPSVPWGWRWTAYVIDTDGTPVSLSIGVSASAGVSLVKRYRHGVGGLFDYGPYGTAWPYLPARGDVLMCLPPSDDPTCHPYFFFPWPPHVVVRNADLPGLDLDADALDFRLDCETHEGMPGIGDTRGPYDALGGCDGGPYCAECLTEWGVIVRVDTRTAAWVWQTWPGPGDYPGGPNYSGE